MVIEVDMVFIILGKGFILEKGIKLPCRGLEMFYILILD